MSMLLERLDGRRARNGDRQFALLHGRNASRTVILECRSAEHGVFLGFRPFSCVEFERRLVALLGDTGLFTDELLGSAYADIYDDGRGELD